MKKIYALIMLLSTHVLSAQNTNYGTSSGTLGTNNSFFGYFSGNGAAAGSSDNAFFGTSSGRLTTTGFRNTAIGSLSLYSNTTGSYNTGIGYQSLYANTTGSYNTALGDYTLNHNTTGDNNAAAGYVSLYWNTTGIFNTSFGAWSSYSNSTGSSNTAFGYNALRTNTTGNYNTAVGQDALFSSTTSSYNTANGYRALYSNTTGYENISIGHEALYSNTIGYQNIAIGYKALRANTGEAVNNTAIGWQALLNNTTGSFNTADGHFAMGNNTTGRHNTAQGDQALYTNETGSYNTAVGRIALNGITTGSYNTAIGYDAGPAINVDNSTALGRGAITTASNQIRVGNSSVSSIGGQVGWTTLSDGRFKKEVKEDISGLTFINHLRPVSYTVDVAALNKFLGVRESLEDAQEAKKHASRQIGFIAQEVDEVVKESDFVFSGIDAPQNENSPYGIRYSEFVVPLVKAVQELSARSEEQQKRIDQLLGQLNNHSLSEIAQQGAVLLQNSPNPFTTETVITGVLPENISQAAVIIYNLEGKQLKAIVVPARGNITVKISASEFPAGMYLYTLIADGEILGTKRMILTK